MRGRGGAGQTRRVLYRQTKRLLVRLVAPGWKGHRYTLELAVRRFLRGRPCNELVRLSTRRVCAMAAAASIVASATAGVLPPVNLADVEAGIGGFVIKGIDTDDQSGWSVSGAGDVNGDGLADVVIGALGADAGGDFNAGECYVVFGKADGAAVNLSAVAAGNGGFLISGIDPNDWCGFSVSGVGDVNGDELDDVVVAAFRADPGGNNSAGESYVVFGKTDGTPVDLTDVVAGNGGFVINGILGFDRAGYSVSGAGDVNGDGLGDLIVGAPFADGGDSYNGESYVVFGKAGGTAVQLVNVAAGIGGFVITGEDMFDGAGFSVSGAGDVNGDGLDDLVVGAPYAGFYYSYAGHSYVVFGKADGDPVSLDAVDGGTGGFVIKGIDDFDASGKAVSGAGDVNGDGLADVIIGAYAATPAGSYSGESYVVFGKANTDAVLLANVAAGSGGFVITGVQAQARSGRAVSGAGDVNGDGLDDVLVSAYLADAPGHQFAGQTYVILGKTDGTAVDLADIIAGTGGWVVNGGSFGDTAGRSISSAGDVNGDGVDDIVIGADGGSPTGAPDAGKSYVVFSPAVRVLGDLNGDGIVGINDFLALLAAWGPCGDPCPPSCAGDLDRDCTVGIQDFLLLLANWS